MTEPRTRTCPVCQTEFVLKPRGGHRRYCSERCRQAAFRQRHEIPAKIAAASGTHGPNRRALEEAFAVSGLPTSAPHLVQAARSLADQVDGRPSSPGLWGRYQAALGQLTPVMVADADDAFAQLLAEINSHDPRLRQLEDSVGD